MAPLAESSILLAYFKPGSELLDMFLGCQKSDQNSLAAARALGGSIAASMHNTHCKIGIRNPDTMGYPGIFWDTPMSVISRDILLMFDTSEILVSQDITNPVKLSLVIPVISIKEQVGISWDILTYPDLSRKG